MTKSKKIHSRDKTVWYLGSKIHRKNKPAIEYKNGRKEFYKKGLLHRKNGPAVISVSGDQEWFLNGERHRDNEPAIITSGGDKYWYHKNDLHRLDGPAIEFVNESDSNYPYIEYYILGIPFDKDEFEKLKTFFISKEFSGLRKVLKQ